MVRDRGLRRISESEGRTRVAPVTEPPRHEVFGGLAVNWAFLIPPGASVLDLGCGSGSFLARLKAQNHRRLVGVELDEKKILACVGRGLDVIQTDLNKGLVAFATVCDLVSCR